MQLKQVAAAAVKATSFAAATEQQRLQWLQQYVNTRTVYVQCDGITKRATSARFVFIFSSQPMFCLRISSIQ